MKRSCSVVVVQTENGPVRINKSDYDADPKAYKLLEADTAAVEAAPAAQQVAAADTSAPKYFIQKDGRKYFVYDLTGVKAGDEDGYTSEAKAKEAIEALNG